MAEAYDPRKDIAANGGRLLKERCPAARRVEVIGDCTLYLGDCMEVMPSLERVDAVVTDPPYGIGITKSSRLAVSRGMGGKTWDDAPVAAPVLALIRNISQRQIIWGGNYFELPPTRAPLVWDKNNAGRDFADFELAWTNLDMVARRIVYRPMNMDGGKRHPTQKPIAVMQWCLSFLQGGGRHSRSLHGIRHDRRRLRANRPFLHRHRDRRGLFRDHLRADPQDLCPTGHVRRSACRGEGRTGRVHVRGGRR